MAADGDGSTEASCVRNTSCSTTLVMVDSTMVVGKMSPRRHRAKKKRSRGTTMRAVPTSDDDASDGCGEDVANHADAGKDVEAGAGAGEQAQLFVALDEHVFEGGT